MPTSQTTHTLMSVNCQWPGFSKSPPWGNRGAGFADAIREAGATIVAAQELGFHQAADLAHKLGDKWSYQRAQGSRFGEGLNAVLWRREWEQEGLIDRNIRRYGQMQRTLLAVPLKHVNGERVTAGSTHFANRAARDLTTTPERAQRGQAADVNGALGTRRRVILGVDSNSPTADYGGREWLLQHGWDVAANHIDLIATRPGVVIQGHRLVPVPSDHEHALVVTFTTNTGDPA